MTILNTLAQLTKEIEELRQSAHELDIAKMKLAKLQLKTTWWKMENAPKDGTEILALDANKAFHHVKYEHEYPSGWYVVTDFLTQEQERFQSDDFIGWIELPDLPYRLP